VQIQALIAEGAVTEGGVEGIEGHNIGSYIEVAKPSVFNREAGRVGEFIMAYRLYLRMRMREAIVKEQIQWILSYIQEGSADVWKENMLEDLEAGEVEFGLAGKFLLELKKEFRGEDEKLVKMVELK